VVCYDLRRFTKRKPGSSLLPSADPQDLVAQVIDITPIRPLLGGLSAKRQKSYVRVSSHHASYLVIATEQGRRDRNMGGFYVYDCDLAQSTMDVL
jgi:hypothetical protein